MSNLEDSPVESRKLVEIQHGPATVTGYESRDDVTVAYAMGRPRRVG